MHIKKNFFADDTVSVAKRLIGKVLKYGKTSGMIVETEAYKGHPDEASHASRLTPRSKIMFDTYGKFYIYFVYGNYFCMNITTEDGKPGAVLIRALEPLDGIDVMKKRRKTQDILNLMSGPGKLCQAMNIGRGLNNTAINEKIMVLDNSKKFEIVSSERIGIEKAKHLKWRFYIKDSKFVSKN